MLHQLSLVSFHGWFSSVLVELEFRVLDFVLGGKWRNAEKNCSEQGEN